MSDPFQKIDLLNDAQMMAFKTREGDVLPLIHPPATPGKEPENFVVTKVETFDDVDPHPETGHHLTRVILTLESQP